MAAYELLDGYIVERIIEDVDVDRIVDFYVCCACMNKHGHGWFGVTIKPIYSRGTNRFVYCDVDRHERSVACVNAKL